MFIKPDIRIAKYWDLVAAGLLAKQFVTKLLLLAVKSPGDGCGIRVQELGILVPPVNPTGGLAISSPFDS